MSLLDTTRRDVYILCITTLRVVRERVFVMVIKQMRNKKGYRQVDVADALDISVRHYQRIEAGKAFPSEMIINKLEDFFQLPQRVLFRNLNELCDLPSYYDEHLRKVELAIN